MTSLCPQVVVHVSVGWKEINNDVIIRSLFLLIMTSRNGGISAPLVVIFFMRDHSLRAYVNSGLFNLCVHACLRQITRVCWH